MTYFHINPFHLRDLDERAALDRALTALAGLPLGYLDTLIAAHEDRANAVEAWCDDWRDENADRLDDLDWPEPEDQPEYADMCDAERRNAAEEHHVTSEQLMHMAVIAELGGDGLAELHARNEMFWTIAEHHGLAIAD
ncbi:hypothetical protein LGM54_30410 [Burkholderia cenocepacia]|uniref:hypothetical protein n=1 Tax=Burkholderia cenocepacia TaxID=95486 RepID=UPI001CF3F913|nr:hypothetical protein [Burkholderia cenocepacia]MCA7967298.1 hypothetical protein [Burkholderia cenocepacia]